MKKVILIFVAFLATSLSAEAKVEEIVVVGANVSYGYSDPETDDSVIEAIEPIKIYTPGRLGGFAGATINGTDTKHTSVYRNGIPVNDTGAGWYDFGTDLPMWQSYLIISGPNSVLFGSSSMAGTIIMEDDYFEKGIYLKGNIDQQMLLAGNTWLQLGRYGGTRGSVKIDNTEEDWYENTTLKTLTEWKGFKFNSVITDYKYDYDDCWSADFINTDACQQEGLKMDSSIRKDWLTVGYSTSKTKHSSYGIQTWKSDNDRYYIDVKEKFGDFLVGATYQKEVYNNLEDERPAIYSTWSKKDLSVGYRYEDGEHIGRLGLDMKGVKISIGNSFRSPNLYERFGDDWVGANPNLKPEKGKGAEVSYNKFTAWRYDFDEGIDFDFADYQYINSGEYTSQGIKYSNHIISNNGSWFLLAQYTDTDRIRVPKWQGKISYYNVWNNIDYMISYVGAYDKGLEFDGRTIDNMSTFNFNAGYYINKKYRIGLQVTDLLDRQFEILPGYSAGGREITISLDIST